MTATYVYVASSWRNDIQPLVAAEIFAAGIGVYDFKHPEGGTGFHWSEVGLERPHDDDQADAADYLAALEHPRAIAGFESDFAAMQRADAFVLVLPCGRSAHLELGWAVGAGKPTAILLEDPATPELMYRMVDYLAPSIEHVVGWLHGLPEPRTTPDRDVPAMTADGTPQVGGTVTTAAGLAALPVGSVVRNHSRAIVAERITDEHGAVVGNSVRCRWMDLWSAGSDITVVFRPDAPQPATGDAVERAVARMEISARDHRESAAQCEDRGDMDGYSASIDAADILDRHLREIRAALEVRP